MRLVASLIFLVAIKSSMTALLPPTNAPECYDNVGASCTGQGLIECCTLGGFVYCSWSQGLFVWTPCLQTIPYCHTTGTGGNGIFTGEDGRAPFCSQSQDTDDVGVLFIDRVTNTGDIVAHIGKPAGPPEVYWNILLNTTGSTGDVP